MMKSDEIVVPRVAQSMNSVDKGVLRQTLKQQRLTLTPTETNENDGKLGEILTDLLISIQPNYLAVYWPLVGEPDLRAYWDSWVSNGWQVCLPETRQGTALSFRKWFPNTEMTTDDYQIPIPAIAEYVLPDCLILPSLGCTERDNQYFRLGYGGGFYDRTLALPGNAVATTFSTIAVTYEQFAQLDFEPEPHDLPVKFIVTERMCYAS